MKREFESVWVQNGLPHSQRELPSILAQQSEIECRKSVTTWNSTSVKSNLTVGTRANHVLKLSGCFAEARTLRVVGWCRGWYFCRGGSMGAVTQVLLQEGAPARPPGKYLQAGTDFGHYLPDLDSHPLPRVAPQLPKRSPLYTRGVRQPSPWILLAAVRGVPWRRWNRALVCWKYWFVLQLCYWETKLCVRFNYHYLVWGFFFCLF